MTTIAKDITFVIPGQMQAADAGNAIRSVGLSGILKASVRIGTQRGSDEPVRVTTRPGEDVVVLTIANGPTLVLHPEDARDLMRAQAGAGTRSALATSTSDEVLVTPQLGWPGLESNAHRGTSRGWMGQALLSFFDVVTGLFKDQAVDLASAAITKKLDGAVEAGVYALSADPLPASLKGSGLKRDALPAAADGGPLLVLVHGTFVDTVSTFGKLWNLHPQTVRELFQHYAGRVYALDHPTLGVSPIGNALTLVRALPAGARLHLLTHSRGGLVAEVLARACGGGALSPQELALFAEPRYEQHRNDLQALAHEAQTKGLKVERVVRVACPARGTTLASKRFDAYLSVLRWGLQLAGVPVAQQLVDFLHGVALRRADPTELPGIEAMMPESAVVAWLNRGEEDLPGMLRVVAGDLQGDTVGSWVKTLLADAFYWTDNDLVVQTRSMYGGAPRTADAAGAGASFLLDRGSKVTHFNYFSNDSTVRAIASALLEDAPGDFKAIGPLSWAGQDSGGTRAARAVARSRGGPGANPANRPAVFVLPGILGSNLKLDGKRIWLGFRFINGLKKLAWDKDTAARVEPDGPIGSTYDDLIERLADSHQVIAFAYDWRRPIEDEARRLAQAVDAALLARNATGQPVRLVAHSMGGLVARAMQLEAPETWKRLMAHDGARLLMLGTPNAGSWAPMQTLSGDDTFGNALVAFGALFDNGGARKMMAAMPGFIQLQAGLLDPALGLDKESTWKKLAEDDLASLRDRNIWHTWDEKSLQRSIYEWGAPPQAVLDQAVALRRRLDAQVAALGSDAQKMLLVIGRAPFTPAGIVLDNDGLSYLDTPNGGDGRVTLASALLPGVRTWKVHAEHGKLPDVSSAFAAYIELLTTGKTTQLEAFEQTLDARSARAAATGSGDVLTPNGALVRSRPSRGLIASSPPSSQADVLGTGRQDLGEGETALGQTSALQVAVLNGDLKFIRLPLLIGHYRSVRLTGAERVIDRLVGNNMSQALHAGLYPDKAGSHQIFGNHRNNPENPLEMARPMAAIVVGLGEEGKLRVVDIVYTVRQAVLAYAQRLSEHEGGAPAHFEMAATLIGSGGTGITAGSAACAIAQGALEANLKLQESGWPQLTHLTLVELYLERAADAWRALQLLGTTASQQVKLTGKVQFGPGAMRRSLDSSYRGANYDFISALQVPGLKPSIPCIAYKLDTKRARTEVRAQHAQGTLLRELVAKASNDAKTDRDIGRTLFNLLIPVEMEPFLGGTSEMVIELEPQTAGIPWELLDTDPEANSDDKRPWAIRSKLIRKLQLQEFRTWPADASPDDNVLVIGEPKCDPNIYPPLPGASREAAAVAKLFAAPGNGIDGIKVTKQIDQNDAQTIINALFKRPYRVVHIAGHGEGGANGGVVLSGTQIYLGANEVNAMRTVPELVFLNCCHLAGRDAASTLKPKSYDRAKFAANIAEALIKIGVRCVIAAGWAVEDDAAEQFATNFYASLLGGARFIEAVGVARNAAWNANRQGNTWAAYQCYGDPEWSWRREGADAQRPPPSPGNEFTGIASPVSLAIALETLAIQSQYSGNQPEYQPERQLDKLRYLESEFAALWGNMGAVAEGFGLAYANVQALDKAIEWYRTAVNAEDGTASFKAAEQLGNQLVSRGEKQVDAAAVRNDIQEGIARLERLTAVNPTLERESLLGSAYKRLTMVEWHAGHENDAKTALEKAVLHYGVAEAIAAKQGADNLYYPAKNSISAELRAAFLAKRLPKFADDRMKAAADSMLQAATDSPDFWSVVGQSELMLLAALANGQLASAEPGLTTALRALKERVPAPMMWDSVYNEALFTLEPYTLMARPAEKHAAQSLLKTLKTLAAA